MKTIKTLAFAAVAVLAVASCQKAAPVSDAVVGFEVPAFEYTLEQGPNFDIPITVTGSNIVYPFTISVNSLPETEENGYSERNVDYRFIDREIEVKSADDKPVVTVRIINEELESLLMGIEIKAVSNGTVNASASTAELAADFGLLRSQGVYQGTGTLNGAPTTETWTFVTEGADYVGFWGLMGLSDMDEYWPVMGEAVYDPETDTSLMSFDFTVDNYITGGSFIDSATGGIYQALLAPILYDGQYVYTSETVEMLCDGQDLQVGLPEGLMITIGQFNPSSGAFLGRVSKGFLSLDGWALERVGDVIFEDESTVAASDVMTFMDVETKEISTYTFVKDDSFVKTYKK